MLHPSHALPLLHVTHACVDTQHAYFAFHPPPAAGQGSGCLGADTLLAMLKNYCRNADIKTAITVGIVGLPNVGKSSLINSLKRSRAAQVRPGT